MSRLRCMAIAMMLVVFCGCIASAQEMIVNGSFSDGATGIPSGWRDGGSDNNAVLITSDTTVYASAPASARGESRSSATGSIHFPLDDLKPGWYRFRGKLKCENMRNSGIALSLRGSLDASSNWTEVAFVRGTQDWGEFDVITRIPDGTNAATLLGYGDFNAGGRFWIDDISMQPAPAPENRFSIFDFVGGTTLRSSYHGWDNGFSGTPEGMLVKANGDGGATINRYFSVDTMGTYVPVLHVKVLPENTATQITLALNGDGTRRGYKFDLPAPAEGFVSVLAKDFTPVFNASEGSGKYSFVRDAQLITAGSADKRLAIVVQGVELVAPGQPVARQPKEGEAFATGGTPAEGAVTYSGDPPAVRSLSVESPEYLALTIDSRYVITTPPAPYEAGENDKLEDIEGMPQLKRVLRDDKLVGYLESASKTFYAADRIDGIPLDAGVAGGLGSYVLSSREDRNFVQPQRPTEVAFKAIPIDAAVPSMEPALRYHVYLHFAKPLIRERNYELAFGFGPKPIKFKYSPLRTRSEAIHVNQVGFRPDDPVKTGRFSLWMGSGALNYVPTAFHVVEEPSGKSVLQGKVQQLRTATAEDDLTPGRSMTGADVWLMDFSELKTPGTYRLFVQDVGVSDPFTIAPTAWQDAFLALMRGFYVQRAGIDKDSPYVEFSRRRMYHPLDGTQIGVSPVTLLETNLRPDGEGTDWRSIGKEQLPNIRLHESFAGYLESGRSNVRHVDHLDATRLHLELFLMFPRVYAKLPLTIPEAGRRDADLLDECLWNVDLYRSLQLGDGGVCGALIDPASNDMYPVPALIGNDLLALSPDVYSTYSYAATAAKAALALQVGNAAAAAKMQQSATKAWEWAERQASAAPSEAVAATIRDRRNLAAVELLRLTSDARYHKAFAETSCLRLTPATSYRSGVFDQREAVFVYARLGDSIADPAMRRAALDALKNDAEAAATLSAGNAWGLVVSDPGYGFFSGSAIVPLINAHYVLKDAKYLSAAIGHASFMLGGNPSNRSFVTGLGTQSTRGAAHTYTRATGKEAPKGLVVPGPFDPTASDMMDWPLVRDNVASFSPSPELWPAAECVLDIYAVPQQSNYSITQTLGPASYLMGYLAAR